MAPTTVDPQRFAVIARVVNKWDPYGLLASGAPPDEFHPEIRAIAWEIANVHSADAAVALVAKVYSAYFTPTDFPVERCRAVGLELFAELQAAGLVDDQAERTSKRAGTAPKR